MAADFPDLPIIMAHMGHRFWKEALGAASVKPNVYMDICNWQFAYNNHPEDFYRTLRAVLDAIGPWRVFFAGDGPYASTLCPLQAWVKAVSEPDTSSCPEVSFTQDEIDAFMGNAFTRLLKISW